MARIKIVDLPKDQKISREELKRVKGGVDLMLSSNILDTSLKFDSTLNLMKIESSTNFMKIENESFIKW